MKLIDADEHPTEEYFIYKSIILHNLYGVDIMKEAVEIAKLRLFLKLVATVDVDYTKPNLGLEPLPDIDFNIRSGNTLIGYTTLADLDKGEQRGLFGSKEKKAILQQADLVRSAYNQFKDAQLIMYADPGEYKNAKDSLNSRLSVLNERLNEYLAVSYLEPTHDTKSYQAWISSHKPFHWLAEFYTTIAQGGFDIIIGNPPYVEYSKVRADYTIKEYDTMSCGNLYAFVTERSLGLLNERGAFGFIVPISLVCTQRMKGVQDLLSRTSSQIWYSNYAERPSKLFVGSEVLLTIVVARKGVNHPAGMFSTGFTKWTSKERQQLFQRVLYNSLDGRVKPYVIQKVSSPIEKGILTKLGLSRKLLRDEFLPRSKYPIYYRIGGGRYWKVFTNFQPQFVLNGKKSVSSRENYLYLENELKRDIVISVLSSSLFFWYFITTTNCRDLNPVDLDGFPFDLSNVSKEAMKRLQILCERLMQDYRKNSQLKDKISSLTGEITYQEFYPRESKPIIDEIDQVLAEQYGLTQEERDFIINYDIKYRMGQDLGEEA